MKLMTEENMDMRITGLLPTLSDSRPKRGEKMNCIRENEPIKTPKAKAPAPTVSGWKGKTGMTMPNPIMSMNVVMTITKEGETLSLLCLLCLGSALSFIFMHSFERKFRYLPLSITKKQSSQVDFPKIPKKQRYHLLPREFSVYLLNQKIC
jgi:hypothetical protein